MTAPASRPRSEALDVIVALLSETDTEVDSVAPSSVFYNRLCEAVCRLTSMERAALFLYDDVSHRVRAVGAHGLDPATTVAIDATLEETPLAQRAFAEDRVIQASGDLTSELPARYVESLGLTNVLCVPLAAGGRWLGVLLADPGGGPIALSDDERDLLWSLGKSAALAACARIATHEQEHARRLRDRLYLAREIHESVVQRLFALNAILGSDEELTSNERRRCSDELEAALGELRRAVQRAPGIDSGGPESTTLRAEVERLSARGEPARVEVVWPAGVEVPNGVDPLARSVLHEAFRNVGKHARPSSVRVEVSNPDGAFSLEVRNDGVGPRSSPAGIGLRLAAFEAMEHGGLVEFGPVDAEQWHVRLLVPRRG